MAEIEGEEKRISRHGRSAHRDRGGGGGESGVVGGGYGMTTNIFSSEYI